MRYRAVIFDMDGVLIDSELYYLQQTHREIVKKYPWISEEDLYPTVGMDSERTRIRMHRLARREPDDVGFDRELEEIYRLGENLHFPDVLYPEVPEVLRELGVRGLKIALASSSSKKAIGRMLRECALTEHFSFVISGDEFQESKPNPQIYLTAMKALDCQPQECLIVEDSSYGVQAGVAAGAEVAARLDDRFPFDQSQATYFIHSLRELPEIVFG
ncbi:HAD family phosphatase [Lachnospiraceae bacterium JLR.KK008]